MSMKTEGARNLAHILSEGNGLISRETVTIANGAGVLEPGAVLGKITASEKFTLSPVAEIAGIEGAETANAVLAYGVDASTQDVEAVITARQTEVKKLQLKYHASVDDADKITAKQAQLASVDIIAR